MPGDTNGTGDVFVKDLQTGGGTRVTAAGRLRRPGQRQTPTIAVDLSAMAATSPSTAMPATWSPATPTAHGTCSSRTCRPAPITRVSIDASGVQGNAPTPAPSISASDGRYVAFYSYASNLVPGDTNGTNDVFVKDLQTGATTRVSTAQARRATRIATTPRSAPTAATSPSTAASNLVAGDTNGDRTCS